MCLDAGEVAKHEELLYQGLRGNQTLAKTCSQRQLQQDVSMDHPEGLVNRSLQKRRQVKHQTALMLPLILPVDLPCVLLGNMCVESGMGKHAV